VSLNNITLNNLSSADTAVVLSLGSREAAGGPAIGATIVTKESVLLLETEPGLLVGKGVHDLYAVVSIVELVGGAIGVPALGEDDDVGGATEGIGEDGARAEVDIRVLTRSLVGRRTIEVPDGEFLGLVLFLRESSGLGSGIASSVNPDVLSHDLALLIEGEILGEGLSPRGDRSSHFCVIWWGGMGETGTKIQVKE